MKRTKSKFIPIIILEFIAVIAVIAILLTIKVCSDKTFGKVKEIHKEYFEEQTVVIDEKATEETEVVKTSNFVNNSFLIPLKGKITSGFGIRNDPFSGKKARHEGTDIAANKGTEIVAAASGTVTYIGYDQDGYGNYLKITHSDNVVTLYAHCSKILVKKGDIVTAGQPIALVGSTGMSTGNHLHFEIIINGSPVNALWYLNKNEI